MKVPELVVTIILAILGSLLLGCVFLPLAALLLMGLWNELASCLHSTNIIGYWPSMKICFLAYFLKCLFGIEFSMTSKSS